MKRDKSLPIGNTQANKDLVRKSNHVSSSKYIFESGSFSFIMIPYIYNNFLNHSSYLLANIHNLARFY